jgi:sodium-dependent dicarboxylate transporter 2/3/5
LDAPEHNPNQKRRLGLAVAMAASIGGMATVIGSPTNAVAAGYLSANQHSLTFVGWMAWGLPLVLVLLGVTGWILGWAIRVPPEAAPMLANAEKSLNRGDAWVIGTGAVTVMLWMMDGWHGLPAAYVALIPVCVFFISGILTAADLRKLDWDVLLLIAGGFALGSALEKSGLAGDVAQVLSRGEQAWQVALSLGGLALFLSVFMSNTAAASLLVPIAGSVGVMDTIHAVLLTAFCCSLGMSLPVSTPPNALMHSRGWVQTRDLMVYGTLISLIALGGMVALVALMGGS